MVAYASSVRFLLQQEGLFMFDDDNFEDSAYDYDEYDYDYDDNNYGSNHWEYSYRELVEDIE